MFISDMIEPFQDGVTGMILLLSPEVIPMNICGDTSRGGLHDQEGVSAMLPTAAILVSMATITSREEIATLGEFAIDNITGTSEPLQLMPA